VEAIQVAVNGYYGQFEEQPSTAEGDDAAGQAEAAGIEAGLEEQAAPEPSLDGEPATEDGSGEAAQLGEDLEEPQEPGPGPGEAGSEVKPI
jgi:hypothetical protein